MTRNLTFMTGRIQGLIVLNPGKAAGLEQNQLISKLFILKYHFKSNNLTVFFNKVLFPNACLYLIITIINRATPATENLKHRSFPIPAPGIIQK
jgi:hypothetical protein